MKKSLLLILALPLLLASCDFNFTSQGQNPGEGTQQNEESNHQNQQSQNNNEEEENNQQQEEEEQEEENENAGENEGNTGENQGISLDEWKEYEFHNGHKPAYNSDWVLDYGGSINPRGCLWENPNEAVDYSGIEFKDKKQILSSPIFNSYPKVEVRFQFWFSAHDSSKYQASDNQPQFKIEEYNSKNTLVNTDSIEIARSDVPKNNTPLEKKIYITQSSMTHFDFKFNNFVPNGTTGYTAILCKISLKGWPQV